MLIPSLWFLHPSRTALEEMEGGGGDLFIFIVSSIGVRSHPGIMTACTPNNASYDVYLLSKLFFII
jgi:hypothetical protein